MLSYRANDSYFIRRSAQQILEGRSEELKHISRRTPAGRQRTHRQAIEAEDDSGFEPLPEAVVVDSAEYEQAWARLLTIVYEIDAFVCPRCRSEMKITALIRPLEEIRKSPSHLVRIGCAPPGFDPAELN